jgi:hypothetical protein
MPGVAELQIKAKAAAAAEQGRLDLLTLLGMVVLVLILQFLAQQMR